MRCTSADCSRCPKKLSMARSSSAGSFVNSWAASLRPLVTTTAARSRGPKCCSMKSRACRRTIGRPERRDVQIVEHDDVDAPRFDVAIRSHVGRHGPAAESQTTCGVVREARCRKTSELPEACHPRSTSKSSAARPVTKFPWTSFTVTSTSTTLTLTLKVGCGGCCASAGPKTGIGRTAARQIAKASARPHLHEVARIRINGCGPSLNIITRGFSQGIAWSHAGWVTSRQPAAWTPSRIRSSR